MMTTAALAGAASILAGVSALQVPALLGSPELRVGAGRAVRGLVAASREWVGRHARAPAKGVLGRIVPAGGRRGVLSRRREQGAIRGRCLDELPEMMDVIVLGLSAGLSFDASLCIYCERYETMLAERMRTAMRSWQLGFRSRREALDETAASMGVGSFTTFVNTVSEALAFGAPLAAALMEQADAVRERRRSDLEEQIEKTPVKMVVPIGTLILPAMLLSITGPLAAVFSNGA